MKKDIVLMESITNRFKYYRLKWCMPIRNRKNNSPERNALFTEAMNYKRAVQGGGRTPDGEAPSCLMFLSISPEQPSARIRLRQLRQETFKVLVEEIRVFFVRVVACARHHDELRPRNRILQNVAGPDEGGIVLTPEDQRGSLDLS
jgi:hypothetical protein